MEGVVLLRGRPEEGRGERRGGRMDGDRTEERDKDGRERGDLPPPGYGPGRV